MAGLWREVKAVTRLATPIAVAHLGQILLGFVDTAVVGRRGDVELAAVGMGSAVYFAAAITGAGVVLGIDPLISQALGAGRAARARATMAQGVWLGLLLAVPLALVALLGGAALEAMGIDPETAGATRAYLYARIGALVPYLVITALVTYLQARGGTRPLVVSALVANVVNVPLDIALVFGDEAFVGLGLPAVGVPALGVVGAGVTSTCVTVVQLGILIRAVWTLDGPRAGGAIRPNPGALRQALRVGLPVGLQRLAEVMVFSATALLAGRIGPLAAASHQVAISLASATFMVPLGISSAAAVRVGLAVGAGDGLRTRAAGQASLLIAGAFMALGALSFVVVPRPLIAILTDDPDVAAATVPLMYVAALFQVSDGLQVVAGGALRGLGDTRAALYYNLVGHYGFGMPIGLGLGFGLGWGVRGLWWGFVAGLTAVAVALSVRFVRRARRPETFLMPA
ncbi:MAG: MATE family efflux transporter [Myxococcota bacterium]